MKKILFMTALLAAFTATRAQDQYRNAVKMNPLSLLFVTGNVSYERAVTRNQSFQLGLFYTGVKLDDVKYSGIGITPEYRFYLLGRKEALNGVYLAPFARYQNFSIKDTESSNEASFSSFGGGATIGWERTWNSGFVVNLFVGPAINSGKVKHENEDNVLEINSGFDGFTIRAGVAIGFAF